MSPGPTFMGMLWLRLTGSARRLSVAGICLFAFAAHAFAASQGAAGIGGMQSQPELPFPSLMRIVVAAVITLALAVGVIVLLKRLAPGIGVHRANGSVIKVVARTNVTPNLRAHVLEIDASRVLIVEGRNGTALTLLPRAEPNEKETAAS